MANATRDKPKGTQIAIDIALQSGLVLTDAVSMLVEKFRQWPWERYDGNRPSDPNVVDAARDIDRVYQLGSRTPRAAYAELLRDHGKEITVCLRRIPADVALEGANLSSVKDPIVRLFDIACGVKHVKMAGATKLLHPFRPKIIPVIDSVVENYYWYATSIRDEKAFRKLSTPSNGDYVFAMLALMQTDLVAARSTIDQLLASCRQSPFATASRVRVLESLIWQYYARPRAAGPLGVLSGPPAF